jgi:pimeloyl-ACP methyl ester carboxylesterase
MEIKDEYLSVNGLRTHVWRAGEVGPAVVLLHGAGTDSARLSWGQVIAPLAENGHRVFAPDLPGYGLSDRPDSNYSTQFYVDFVGALLDALGLEQAGLMGLSMGGAIAIGVMLRWPERISHLALVDSYGLQRKVAMHFISWLTVMTPGAMESTWALVRRYPAVARWLSGGIFHDPRAIPPELMAEMLAEARQPYAGRAFTRYQRDEVKWNGLKTVYLSRLPEIVARTLIIHGREDTAVPLACAEEANRLIRGSQLHVIDGAGHWSQREKPEEFLRTALEFFEPAG